MTREDIIRMAREAGIDYSFGMELERFAALVAAAEREACAKVCEGLPSGHSEMNYMHEDACQSCAAAIRARGEKP